DVRYLQPLGQRDGLRRGGGAERRGAEPQCRRLLRLADRHAQPRAGRRPDLAERFTGEGVAPAKLDTILHADLAMLRAAREAEDERILGWIDSLSDKALAGRFTYTTVTDMRTVSQRLAPALAHFFNHQTHHRGQ